MNLYFDFENHNPPALTEKELRKENERRDLQKQILLLRIAAFLVSLCLVLFALIAAKNYAIISIICILFAGVYVIGSGVISVVFFSKRREIP